MATKQRRVMGHASGIARPPQLRKPKEPRKELTPKEVEALLTVYELGKSDDSLTYKKIGQSIGVDGSSARHRCEILFRLGLININPVRITEAGTTYILGLP